MGGFHSSSARQNEGLGQVQGRGVCFAVNSSQAIDSGFLSALTTHCNFSKTNMMVPLTYHQHIIFPARGDQTPGSLDRYYTPFKECYNPISSLAVGKAGHCVISLTCEYRQNLKQEKPV